MVVHQALERGHDRVGEVMAPRQVSTDVKIAHPVSRQATSPERRTGGEEAVPAQRLDFCP